MSDYYTLEKELSKISGVYRWTSPSGRCYIGQTVDLGNRHKDFRCASESRCYAGKNSVIDKARQKYSYQEWKYEVLEYCPVEQLDEREKYYIEKYKPEYNITKGGVGGCGVPKSAFKKGHVTTEEQRQKKRETLKKHIEEGVIDFSIKCKPIAFYTLDGCLYKVFNSHKEAAEYFNVSITFGDVIKRNTVFKKKYLIREVDEDIPLFIEQYEKKKVVISEEARTKMSLAKQGKRHPHLWRAIIGTDSNNETVEFMSITDAAKTVNPNNPKAAGKNINGALSGKKKRAYGYEWRYAS